MLHASRSCQSLQDEYFVRLANAGMSTCQGCAGDGLTFSYCVDGNKNSLTMSLPEHFTMTSSSFPPSQFGVPSLMAAEAFGSVRLRMLIKQVKSMREDKAESEIPGGGCCSFAPMMPRFPPAGLGHSARLLGALLPVLFHP